MNEFYAYWNAQQMRDLLEAIVFIVGGGDFLGLLRAIAIVGLLVVTTGSILSMRYEHSFLFLLGLAFFYMVLLLPKQSVTVRDVRAGTVYVVNNVPVGVAAFAAGTSHIGYWLTNIFETAFMPADDVARFSRFGLGFPQRAITAVQNLGAVTPQGREMLSSFVRDCVVAEMLESPAKANEVVRSADIWATLTQPGWLNPARTTVMTDGTVQTCPNMPGVISVYLANQEIPALREALGHKLVGDRPNPSAAITAALPQVEALLMGMSRTFEDSMRQAVMLEAIPNGITLAGASAEPLALAVNMSAAQANVASVINYRTMANMAKNFLPSIRNAIEFVVIAAFPLIVLMVLAAGHRGGLVLKGFFVMVIWVQLWAPLYAVINYLMITVDANPLSQIQAAFGGNSLASVNLIREIGATSQDIAGMMSIMVPVVAYALAKSSEIATTSMISTVFAPASSAAQAMGSQLSQGNVSLGNMAWGNVNANNASANKHDMSTSWSDPAMVSRRFGFGETRYQDGRLAGVEAATWSPGAGASAQRQDNLTNKQSSGQSVSSSWAAGSGFNLTQMAQSGNAGTARFSRELRTQIESIWGGGVQASGQDQSNSTDAFQTQTSGEGSLANSEGASFNTQPGATGTALLRQSPGAKGAGLPAVGSAPAAAALMLASIVQGAFGLNVRTAQDIVDTATGRNTQATSAQRSLAAAIVNEAVARVMGSAADSGVRGAAKEFSAAFNRQAAASLSDSVAVGGERSAAEGAERLIAGGAQASVDMGPRLVQALIGQYGSAERMLQARGRDPEGFERNALAIAGRLSREAAPGAQVGMQRPADPQSVVNDGFGNVSNHAAGGRNRVTWENDQNQAQVRGLQPVDPVSPANLGPANEAFGAAWNAALARLREQQEKAILSGGAVVAGSELYKISQKGMGTVMSNALLFGRGYQSPRELTAKMLDLAQANPGVRAVLMEMGRGRFDASSETGRQQLDYLAQELKKAKQSSDSSDQRPGSSPFPMP